MAGRVESIIIGPEKKTDLQYVDEVRAVPGRGLEGDRYFLGVGSFNRPELMTTGRDVTLIELEAIDACNAALETTLEPRDLRRNIVTSAIRLNDLVGKDFRIGEVALRGVRLCHPCGFLAKLVNANVTKGLKGVGGLRAEIQSEGTVRVGDAIV